MRKYSLFFLMSFLFPGCHKSNYIIKKVHVKNKQETAAQEIPIITVFTHGTKLFAGSFYCQTFGGKPGIKHVSELPQNKYSYALFKRLSEYNPQEYPYEHLYYFGWSGYLSAWRRLKIAKVLYNELLQLSNDYYEVHHVRPRIRLVGHSHGASVALSLAPTHAREKADLAIDQLVLLACPVQHILQPFTQSPLFESIYAFYASLDFVQVIAPQYLQYIYDDQGNLIETKRRGYIFSGQTFGPQLSIKQARVKLNSRTPFHCDFMDDAFLRALPDVLDAMDAVYAEHGDEIKSRCKEVVCSIR